MTTKPPPDADPMAMARSRAYLRLLVLAAIIGVPISALAYFFLALVDKLQEWVFESLPDALGYDATPSWWPLIPLTLAGVLVAAAIRYLPGRGGESPAEGFKAGRGPAPPEALPGIFLAALAGLALGAVIGPEAPLIALGGGLAAALVRLQRGKKAPDQVGAVLGATGSFAAVSTLLGSPLVGAVLMLEASGLGGAMVGLVLVPGLLASGIGYIIFLGLDSLTGLGTFSLALPEVPGVTSLEASWLAWAVAAGVAAAVLVTVIRRLALLVRPRIEGRILPTALAGLLIGLLALVFTEVTDKPYTDVLFSGQSALGPLIAQASAYGVGALILIVAFKGLAYAISLGGFRGGPVFPSMFIGAAGGIAMSHLPGLTVIAGVAIGMAAMLGAMLRLPIVSVLLTSVFLEGAGPDLVPPVIVAVVVAYAASAWLLPRLEPAEPAPPLERGAPAA